MAVSRALAEIPMNPLKLLSDLVIPLWVKIAVPLVIGALLVGGVWIGVAKYNGVVAARDRLASEVLTLGLKNQQLTRSIAVLETTQRDTLDRREALTTIKEEIRAIPAVSLPADIQLTFDRLRDREASRTNRPAVAPDVRR